MIFVSTAHMDKIIYKKCAYFKIKLAIIAHHEYRGIGSACEKEAVVANPRAGNREALLWRLHLINAFAVQCVLSEASRLPAVME